MAIASSKRGGRREGAGRKPKPADAPYDPYATEWFKAGVPTGIMDYVREWPGATLGHKLENLIADHYLFRPLGPGKARARGEGGRFVKGGGLYEAFAERRHRPVHRKRKGAA